MEKKCVSTKFARLANIKYKLTVKLYLCFSMIQLFFITGTPFYFSCFFASKVVWKRSFFKR